MTLPGKLLLMALKGGSIYGRGRVYPGIFVKEALHVFLQPGKQLRIPDQAVLYYFRHPRGVLPPRQRVQELGVNEHTLWLVERSNHVLPQWVVHSRLSPHRGVDCGHHCGGNLQMNGRCFSIQQRLQCPAP